MIVTRWCADDCVPTAKVSWRPPGNSRSALASRSVLNFGSQSIVATTRDRLRAENVARGQDGVAADVVHPAAAGRPIAHIVGVEQAVGEEGLDRLRFPDRSVPRKLTRAAPLRVEPHHEGLSDQLAGALARVDQLARFLGVERDRLLAKHMFSGRKRANRPGNMLLVGQRIVDRLDLGVRE